MPSKSKKQRKFMRAAAHNPKFAKKVGIKQSVAREFYEADKARGYARGGPLRSSATGFRTPVGPGPRASRGSTGTLGSPTSLGPLGAASGRSGGFARGSVGGGARPLSGGPLEVSRVGSNLRPRPGRGVNALLATAATPYHEATDRLAKLRRGLG